MNEKLLNRTVAERMFARQSSLIEKLLADTSLSSVRIVERQLAELASRWIILQEKSDSYTVEFCEDAVEISAISASMEKYLAEYIRLEVACDKFILSHSVAQSVTTNAAPTALTSNAIKLERVKFRMFDGDLRKYPKFKSEFEQYVKPLCQAEQLPFLLKSYLCDSVRREVEHIDHDISAMWSRLDEKYGSVQKQIDYILRDFKKLPKCNDPTTTLNMIRVVELAEADLTCMNAAEELENHLIISYIEKSMSENMMRDWAEQIANHKDRHDFKAKLAKLMEFLRHWRWLIEYCNAEIRTLVYDSDDDSETSDPVHVNAVHHAEIHPISTDQLKAERKTTVESSVNHADIRPVPSSYSYYNMPSNRKCLVHPDANHPVWRCRTFRNMTLTERKHIVESNNACTHCLETGHAYTDCKMRFKCTVPDCGSTSHNLLLHEHGSA